MTVAFKVLGFTLASIDVDLGDLAGGEHRGPSPLAVQHRPPVVNTLVKAMSNGWVKRMMA